MLGIDRLGYWANQYGFGEPTGIDLPGEASGHRPDQRLEAGACTAPTSSPARRTRPGIGQGYDVVTPIQLINAFSALANGGTLYKPQLVREVVGPDGTVVRPFEPEVIHEMDVARQRAAGHAQRGPRDGHPPPHLQPRRSAHQGGRQVRHGRVRHADSQGRLPYHSWFVGFVPKDATKGSFDKADSELVVLAFAYDSRTKGNAATEIVKYFLQLHYDIEKDYRNHDLLERGNFYQSN